MDIEKADSTNFCLYVGGRELIHDSNKNEKLNPEADLKQVGKKTTNTQFDPNCLRRTKVLKKAQENLKRKTKIILEIFDQKLRFLARTRL